MKSTKGNQSGHGGKRKGSGRPPKAITELKKSIAASVLSHISEDVGGEEAVWLALYEKAKNDPRLRFDILKFHTEHRDGKAPQAVTVGGQGGGPIIVKLITSVPRPEARA